MAPPPLPPVANRSKCPTNICHRTRSCSCRTCQRAQLRTTCKKFSKCMLDRESPDGRLRAAQTSQPGRNPCHSYKEGYRVCGVCRRGVGDACKGGFAQLQDRWRDEDEGRSLLVPVEAHTDFEAGDICEKVRVARFYGVDESQQRRFLYMGDEKQYSKIVILMIQDKRKVPGRSGHLISACHLVFPRNTNNVPAHLCKLVHPHGGFTR